MGKKVKKDDKGPPEDVFDPLLVESRQAATVVLMLESPESEVQAKACEAIYRFVNKCDENKRLLLELGACDHLLRLLLSEEKVVRRNSVMALGVMLANPEVRKCIRKNDKAVPLVLKLLNPEEYNTTREFATLGLTSLCNEYTSIACVLDNSGMDLLIECLREEDPDVQKNAIECISLLLQDFEARSIVKDGGGLEAMLELLKSEYPVIQEFTLIAFIRATQDAGNRTALREMECIRTFVDMIGKPEYNDVHVHALHVLANIVDDTQSLQQMKESGGLARLVAFITDAQPPEDEQKADKGKKGGKGSAKKGKAKGGDDDKKDESVPSHTLPEVKMHTCKAIMRSARSEENRKVLHEADTEKMLVQLLNNDDETVRCAAAEAIAVMCESALAQDTIGKMEGLEPLVKMVKSDHRELKEAGSLALANLTTGNMNNANDVAARHGIEHLVGCLAIDQERIQGNALTALTNMSTDEGLRQQVISQGFVAAIIQPLNSESTLVQSKATLASAAFINEAHTRAEFRASAGLEPLVRMLKSNHHEVRRSACWAVTVLAVDEDTALELYRLGTLDILQEINESETRRNRFSEAAIQRLYDNNLTTKYALTGYLSFTDHIADEFYDPGQLRPGTKLLSLDEYGLQTINNRRPILLINITTTIDSDRRSKKDKDDAPATPADSTIVELPQVYVPPEDPTLQRYLQDVKAHILPLTSTKDQVAALARFVAEKMGGAIERGQVMNFSYELPIGQLKFNLKSNVIPLGLITTGIHPHRALLCKFLADRIGIPMSLVRGEYNRAWNEVWLSEERFGVLYPPSLYIVDLVHEPGSLLRSDSVEAANYTQI